MKRQHQDRVVRHICCHWLRVLLPLVTSQGPFERRKCSFSFAACRDSESYDENENLLTRRVSADCVSEGLSTRQLFNVVDTTCCCCCYCDDDDVGILLALGD